ncbi:sphingomyelinase [Raphidocelis subcapitata]|uniref:Sphingomyelinase n=1 Tax=Raphidocelis subcapitata TaxID=307507 RepID=A0A2V0PN85_9CHLO|nr:sphingomyelinase [Raphidocelis subcapitata]|eukprot:GBF99380.1 sphingomyelinase [Raphidocelis subcapitata]
MGEFQSSGAPPSDMSAEPPLYCYKQFIVVLVLSAAAIVLVSPFTPAGGILWYLVIFTSLNLFNGLGQTLRMVSAVRKLRARVVPRAPGSGPIKVMPKGGHATVGSWDAAGAAAGEAEGACLLHVEDAPAWHHVFVIPNYKEDLAVLCATLDRLASHRFAPNYTILLAMEEKEANAEQKAAQLQEQYCLRFKAILFTLHSLDPVNEMPGKSSNVNAAVRQFSATVPPSERARYMLTIMDADALVPPAYVLQLEATTAGVGASAPDHIYAAPVMFEQNGYAVPSLVRVTDYTWGALAMQNLNNWSGVGFPISNYSLSLALAAAVDYWDTWWVGLWAGPGLKQAHLLGWCCVALR